MQGDVAKVRDHTIYDSAIQVMLARKSEAISPRIIMVFLRHASRRALPGSHYPEKRGEQSNTCDTSLLLTPCSLP
jgi:hypothetical protein